ncbi:hypothetical protein ME7_00843 [Bartonella birtlesii LL-WM9]|uniref:Uncharacterized protein n=1 Tax=Bartonella birtlesii LL-WM9 TaxID=1094552 RepID=J0PVF0_9HYPH|nr:hypothetical protein ME7_00843 [Bartonella birtlesii LL-WM9]
MLFMGNVVLCFYEVFSLSPCLRRLGKNLKLCSLFAFALETLVPDVGAEQRCSSGGRKTRMPDT